MTPIVSIIIPAHGECKYLKKSLLSIIKSNFYNYEIIVIDDGMSPGAITLVRNFVGLKNVKLIKNTSRGLVSALNLGLNHSKGKYIARLDSDDEMLPDRLKIQVNYLDSNTDIAVVGSNCYYMNESGDIIGKSNYPVGIVSESSDFNKRCLIAHPSVMFRRECVQNLAGYREIFYWNKSVVAEDFDLWLRLSKTEKIANTSEFLIMYRQHQEQISSRNISAQIVGSLYVSAINILDIPAPIKLDFTNRARHTYILMNTIFKAHGFHFFIFALLKYIQSILELKFKNTNFLFKIPNLLFLNIFRSKLKY